MSSKTANRRGPNPQQLQAIEATEGPVQIIAGPGSGKTYTLVERIVHIIQKHDLEPKNFLIVTFTEKAAAELKTRISNRLSELGLKHNVNEMLLGTFHSVCLKFLEEYREHTRLKRNYILMDQFDQQYMLYQKMKHFSLVENCELITGDPAKTSRWSQSESLLKWINKISEEAIDIGKLKNADEPSMRALAELYEKYQDLLAEKNSLDFSTIQTETLKLLKKNAQVADKIRAQIQYIMVDEYQDTNSIQEMLLKELMNEKQNICVVGDDDQGLYRFRGASIRNILEFKNLFPKGHCKEIKLETNYRSHPDIVKFYAEWMEDQIWEVGGVDFRFDKHIHAQDGDFPKSPAVIKASAEVGDEWPDEVRKFLLHLRDSGKITNWNQVAFLFRSVKSDQALRLARELESSGIPIYSPRSNLFFERPEVCLMFGALLFLFAGNLKELQYYKKRDGTVGQLGIWDFYNKCLNLFTAEIRKPENEELKNWAASQMRSHQALSSNTDYSFLGLFYRLLKYPLFSSLMPESQTSKGLIDERPMRNLSIFSQLLAKFEYLHHITVLGPEYLKQNLADLFNNYMRYVADGGISEYEDDSEYAPSGCISFLTIHQAKGLEFPIVIVDSLNTEPRKQFTDIDEIIETKYLNRAPFEPMELTKFFDFKRLYYTAFSRAQNLLVLSCQEENRKSKKKVPTKYFKDHYEKLVSWSDPRFDVTKFEFDAVKNVNLKNEYSFTTHINIFENCAQQYRFFKEFKFNPVRTGPIIFGTLVHETIEDIHKAALNGEVSTVTDAKIEEWFNKNYEVISKAQRVYLNPAVLRIALSHVVRYFHREKNNFDRLREAEVEVSYVKDNYILKGKIDLIRGAGDTVEIVDFKSENKPDLEAERHKIAQYQRQLEIYAHIVEGRTDLKVSKMHLYYTSEESGNPFVTFERSDSKIEATITEIDKVVARIENKDFAIKERPTKSCKNCDMRFHCDDKYKKAA